MRFATDYRYRRYIRKPRNVFEVRTDTNCGRIPGICYGYTSVQDHFLFSSAHTRDSEFNRISSLPTGFDFSGNRGPSESLLSWATAFIRADSNNGDGLPVRPVTWDLIFWGLGVPLKA
jgi:hypothetical protein